MGNSIYGKVAQGLKARNRFSFRTDSLEKIGESFLSNSFIATSTTGFIRAVLSNLLNQCDKLKGIVVSCTTDGFITNIPDLADKIEYDTLLSKLQAVRIAISGDKTILECKHTTRGLFAWRTRGQIGDIESGLKAMTGYQGEHGETLSLIERNFYTTHHIDFFSKSLRSPIEIYKEGGHLTPKVVERRVSLKADGKRGFKSSDGYKNGFILSQPLKDTRTFQQIRGLSELSLQPSILSRDLLQYDVKGKYITNLIQFYTRRFFNLKPEYDVIDFCQKINELSPKIQGKYPLSFFLIERGKEAKPGSVPLSQEVLRLKERLSGLYPDVSIDDLSG